MSLHPCGLVAKLLLTIINLICVLVGFIVIGAGTTLLVEKEEFQVLTGDDNLIIGIGFIVSGCFIILISCLGMISSIGEMTPLLVVYSVLMFCLIGVEVAGAAVSYSDRDRLTHNADAKFVEYMGKYRDPNSQDFDSKVNEVIDIAQKELHCCGQGSPFDWAIHNKDYTQTIGFPASCCCDPASSRCINITANVLNCMTGGVWSKGCNETFYGALGSNFVAIGGAGIGIALVQLFMIFLGISLCFFIMAARSTDQRIARIQAAAYTQLESLSKDAKDDPNDDQDQDDPNDYKDQDDPNDYKDQEPPFRSSSNSEYTTRTVSDEMEPNDSILVNDRSVYIQ